MDLNCSLSNCGRLELIFGPMYSGKTSRLLSIYRQLRLCGINTIIVNHDFDTRYSASPSLVTNHDSLTTDGIACSSLMDSLSPESQLFRQNTAFLINEAQFFNDIVEWTKQAVNPPHCKTIYLAGLDGDYKRQPFGSWLSLIPYADSVEKLTAVCTKCKRAKALFTWRTSTNRDQVLVSDNCHIPVCRACYDNVGNVGPNLLGEKPEADTEL